MSSAITSAVIIPARNEERRLPTCLAALSPQIGDHVLVVVVANNCADDTACAARGMIARDNLELLECTLEPGQGVGAARRLGCLHALPRYPNLKTIMTTDADCIVAPDWIAATERHLCEVDAVCGRVVPIPAETSILAHLPSQEGWNEAIYRQLVLLFYELLAPENHNAYPHHGEAAGASLACLASAWWAVGGFPDVRTGEDRDLVRRLRGAGFRVRHAEDVSVQASCRLHGRAPGGMADALRDRLAGLDYLVDEALPPVADLVSMARRGQLAHWPPHTSFANRLRPADLPEEIQRLTDLTERIKAARGISKLSGMQTNTNIPIAQCDIPMAMVP